MAPPKSPEDRIKLSKLFKMLKPHSADIEDFPDNERDFAALSAAELSSLSDEALLEMKNGPTSDARLHRAATQANNEIVSKKEAEELNSLHTALENAGIANLPGKEEFAKLPIKNIKALAEAAAEKAPSQEDSIRDLFFPVSYMKAVRKEEEEKLAQENLRGASFQATIEPTTELKETEHSPPTKESNRVTFKDAMELKNESIKEKNEEQTWRGNLANRIKGVGRVLYAIPAIPIEGAKGIFNAVRSVPVMAGGALKASWGAIRGNQELKENGISMMSAGGHMALQGVTAFIRAPVSLIKEGVMNIATGQRQENTFRAKQHATRITREKGKGNLNISENSLPHSSKTTQKIVEKMRSSTAVEQGTTVRQSAATGKNRAQDTRGNAL